MGVNVRALSGATATCEAKFDQGYRYYDRCGEALSRIKALDDGWSPKRIAQDTGLLVHESYPLVCRMNSEQVFISKDGNEWLPHLELEALSKVIAEKMGLIYPIITEIFEVPNSIRIGARFSFIASADSLEDAQSFVATRTAGRFREVVEGAFRSQVFGGEVKYELEDAETGIRRNFAMTVVARTATKVPKPSKDRSGVAALKDPAVEIDIDTYTRPDNGHLSDVGQFLISSFNSARTAASRIFESS